MDSNLRAKAARAALRWIETTHGNTIGEHDHHCRAAKWKDGKQVDTGKPCTCGWGNFQNAYDEYIGWVK